MKILPLALLISLSLFAQEAQVEPTWLRRSTPPPDAKVDATPRACDYQPIFGEGDSQKEILRTVTRFGALNLGAHSDCSQPGNDRQEQIYFVLKGNAVLHLGTQNYPMRANDFTYIAPGKNHSLENTSEQPSRVLVMGFKIPPNISIGPAAAEPKIVNLADVKEETVSGHPTSVLYKLLIGAHTASRDALDQAYIVTSFFWMDFAPGGTNFPHHHEGAEEIYLVMDGAGEMAAGSGLNGVEGRYPAKAGDAYFFRANCTVGFYNQNKPNAKAHILAIRARIPPPDEDD